MAQEWASRLNCNERLKGMKMPILDGIKRRFQGREEKRAVFDRLQETLDERIANSADAGLAAKLAPGTVVRLKSGGPEMTVKTNSWANSYDTGVSVSYPNGFAKVSWFREDGHMETGSFGAEELDIVAAEPPTDEDIDALISGAKKWRTDSFRKNVVRAVPVELVFDDGSTRTWTQPGVYAGGSSNDPDWDRIVAWRYV